MPDYELTGAAWDVLRGPGLVIYGDTGRPLVVLTLTPDQAREAARLLWQEADRAPAGTARTGA